MRLRSCVVRVRAGRAPPRRSGAALRLLPALALAPLSLAASEEWRGEERRGDASVRRAATEYHAAFETWGRAAALSAPLGDEALASRSRAQRAALAALLLDPGRYEIAAGPDAPLARAPPLTIEDPSLIDERELRDLIGLLSAAARRYATLPEKEARDVPLIYELLALAQRVLGDVHQARADQAYQTALAGIEPHAPESARYAVAAARLRYKLRDFDGACRIASLHEEAIAALDPGARIEHLRRLQAIATFRREEQELLALGNRIRGLGGKAEQPPRPFARLAGLPVGSHADLAATATALVRMVANSHLGAREAALAAYFAGVTALELGEYALVEEILRERHLAVADDAWLAAAILARCAAARDRLGDYEGALALLDDARSRAGAFEDAAAFRARLDINRARAVLGLGDPVGAATLAAGVVRDPSLPGDLRIRARLLAGSCLYERARSEKSVLADARRAFEAALRDVEAGRALPHRDELGWLASIHLANVLRLEALEAGGSRAVELREEAIRRQDAAMREASEAGDHALAAVAASNLGELYLEAGNLDAARRFVGWALDRAREERQFETEWRCHWYLARIVDAGGDEERADREYEEAARIVEAYRSRILDAEAKRGFMTDKLDLFRAMVRRHLARGRAESALETAERGRSRALVESLGWRMVTFADSGETKLYREYVSLLGREAVSRDPRAAKLLGVKTRALEFDRLRARITELRRLVTESKEASPALRALVTGAPATVAEIVAWLPPGAALVEYYFTGEGMVAFVVQDGLVSAVPLDAGIDELKALAGRFLADHAGDEATARRLHALLVAPIEPAISGERIIIVPYGPLFRFPFEALRGPDGFLLERWTVSYLPAASLLRYVRLARGGGEEAARGPRLLALADPDTDYDGDGRPDRVRLEHARAEVSSFASSFAAPLVLSDGEAQESALVALARGWDVIHLACHGEFYPARPWDSTLFLAPGGDGEPGPSADGRLRAAEVYALDLRSNRLVVLSGCETGRSDLVAGDDPAGIATAFLHSGAPALLASLWKVEDAATAELMRGFYRKWLSDGVDRVEALRAAKLALLRGGHSHPRQWAAFTFVGDR